LPWFTPNQPKCGREKGKIMELLFRCHGGFVAARKFLGIAGIAAGIAAEITTGIGFLGSAPASAASVYAADATAVLGLSTSGSFDNLLYLGSQVGYSAHAEANSNGLQDRLQVTERVEKAGSPVSFGSLFSNGNDLSDIFLNTSKGRQLFTDVTATAGGAHAEGETEGSSPGANGGRFAVSTSGFATDLVESANSAVSWNLFIAFQNASNDPLAIEWSLAPGFHNEAKADPRGSAFSRSIIQAARGTFDNGARVFETDPLLLIATACGFNHPTCLFDETPADPPIIERLFGQSLAPGETAFFNFALEVSGNASVVPVPAALPLMATGLVAIGFLSRRRRRKTTI